VVTVRSLPNVSLNIPLSTFCSDSGPVTLTGGSPANGTYTGQGISNGDFYPATVSPGQYNITYTYTDSFGCSASATQLVQVDICTGIDSYKGKTVTVYPNPVTDYVVVKWSEFETVSHVSLYSSEGKLIQVIDFPAGNQVSLKAVEMANGMYFIKIQTDKNQYRFPFIKQ
jgi:hypothetical protein